MSYLSRDNSIANRYPYPAVLQEVMVSTDLCAYIPTPSGQDFSLNGFGISASGAGGVGGFGGPPDPEHPGIAVCSVAAAGDDGSIALPRDTFDANDSAVRVGAVMRFIALTDNNTIAGVGSRISAVGSGGPRVQIIAQVGANGFVCETTGLNGQVTAVAGVPLVLGRWYRLEIVSLGTTNSFFIDGVLVATHRAVAVTLDSCEAGIDAPPAVGTAGTVHLDLVYAYQSGLNR